MTPQEPLNILLADEPSQLWSGCRIFPSYPKTKYWSSGLSVQGRPPGFLASKKRSIGHRLSPAAWAPRDAVDLSVCSRAVIRGRLLTIKIV